MGKYKIYNETYFNSSSKLNGRSSMAMSSTIRALWLKSGEKESNYIFVYWLSLDRVHLSAIYLCIYAIRSDPIIIYAIIKKLWIIFILMFNDAYALMFLTEWKKWNIHNRMKWETETNYFELIIIGQAQWLWSFDQYYYYF